MVTNPRLRLMEKASRFIPFCLVMARLTAPPFHPSVSSLMAMSVVGVLLACSVTAALSPVALCSQRFEPSSANDAQQHTHIKVNKTRKVFFIRVYK